MDLKKLITSFLIAVSVDTIAMVQSKNLRKMLIGQPSLKYLATFRLASINNSITKEQAPEEVINFVNEIRLTQSIEGSCFEEEKKFFVNLLNNPGIDIERYFSNLIKKYLVNEDYEDKYQLLNLMLLYASVINNLLLIQLLLDHGANINIQDKDGFTPLMLASRVHKEVVEFLIDKGSDVNIKNNKGVSALTGAIVNGKIEIVKILLDACANANIKGNIGQTPLMIAIEFSYEDLYEVYKQIIEMLLDYGADVDAQDDNGDSALLIDVLMCKKFAQILLDKGANVNLKDKKGKFALIWAAFYNQKKIVKMMLSKNADIEIQDDEGRTALMESILYGRKKIIKLLINYGANVNVSDKAGNTALSFAQMWDNNEIIQMLNEAGARE